MSTVTPSDGASPVADDLTSAGRVDLPPSDALTAPITITFLPSKEASVGQRHPTTLGRLFHGFANYPLTTVKDKSALPGFALAVFAGNHRRADKVQQVFGVALDIDNKRPPPVTFERLLDALTECTVFIYSSFSHQPDCPRFRAILPASRAMSAAEYATVWQSVERHLRDQGIEIDQACRDASRLWFWPARVNEHFTTRLQVGRPLDVDGILTSAPKPIVRDVTIEDRENIAGRGQRGRTKHPSHLIALTRECEFVKRLASDPAAISYQEWFAAATILKAFEHGEQLFHELSALDAARYTPDAAQKLIGSIQGKPTHCDKLGWACPRRASCAAIGVRSPAGLPFKLGRRS